ncbi:hypothetical protein AAHA92_22568 [Salvia divinorum]|uniref:Uncharacterized protein n=1 Tax=Salvia divinorum TaxID=28513 RepID=A0ABD1GPL8_SALDI
MAHGLLLLLNYSPSNSHFPQFNPTPAPSSASFSSSIGAATAGTHAPAVLSFSGEDSPSPSPSLLLAAAVSTAYGQALRHRRAFLHRPAWRSKIHIDREISTFRVL